MRMRQEIITIYRELRGQSQEACWHREFDARAKNCNPQCVFRARKVTKRHALPDLTRKSRQNPLLSAQL